MRRSLFAVLSLALLIALATACTSAGPKPTATGSPAGGNATAVAKAATPRPPTAPAASSPAAPSGAAIITPGAAGPALVTTGPAATAGIVAASTGAPAAATGSAATCTDRASMTQDVTVPDNTAIPAGQTFVKTWRLRNTGTCTWDTSYSLIFAKGNNLGGPVSVPISTTVAPGASTDASVNLTAPTAAGTYKGNWQLRNGHGTAFGIPTSDGTFWVQIVVGPAARVTFPAGSSTATLNATLTKGVPRGYGLQAQAGQKVTVKASAASNAALTVQDSAGNAVETTQPAEKQWEFTAAQAGEYVLVWRGSGPMTFTVTVAR